jgi:hypothetical protein
MAKQPCSTCGRLVIVDRKELLSWGMSKREEDKVFCIKCTYDARQSIILPFDKLGEDVKETFLPILDKE